MAQIAGVGPQTIEAGGVIARYALNDFVGVFVALLPIILFVVAVPILIGMSRLNVISAAVWFVIGMSILTVWQWGMRDALVYDSEGTWTVPLTFVLNILVFVVPFFVIYWIAMLVSSSTR